MIISTDINECFSQACQVLKRGGLVGLPTETVYGLSADATNGTAVAKIFAAKGRPSFNPLIAHVCDMEMAQDLAYFTNSAHELARAFWPGPLTLVLNAKDNNHIHPLVSAQNSTIALRHPKGAAAQLIKSYGRPLAAPSANRSGKISPTTAQDVADDLGDRVDLILDGGPTQVGLESTIIDCSGDELVLLRPGGLSLEEIESFGFKVAIHAPHLGEQTSPIAPGMLSSHYAPNAYVRLDAHTCQNGEALLAFGPKRLENSHQAFHVFNLSQNGDLVEAAANLYTALRFLDRTNVQTIAVEPIPMFGLGLAIRDRLTRAAAPRNG